MRRKRRIFQHSNTQGYPLRGHIELHHPLVELADMIDWAAINVGLAGPNSVSCVKSDVEDASLPRFSGRIQAFLSNFQKYNLLHSK